MRSFDIGPLSVWAMRSWRYGFVSGVNVTLPGCWTLFLGWPVGVCRWSNEHAMGTPILYRSFPRMEQS